MLTKNKFKQELKAHIKQELAELDSGEQSELEIDPKSDQSDVELEYELSDEDIEQLVSSKPYTDLMMEEDESLQNAEYSNLGYIHESDDDNNFVAEIYDDYADLVYHTNEDDIIAWEYALQPESLPEISKVSEKTDKKVYTPRTIIETETAHAIREKGVVAVLHTLFDTNRTHKSTLVTSTKDANDQTLFAKKDLRSRRWSKHKATAKSSIASSVNQSFFKPKGQTDAAYFSHYRITRPKG